LGGQKIHLPGKNCNNTDLKIEGDKDERVDKGIF
jgi:hypothetical protein